MAKKTTGQKKGRKAGAIAFGVTLVGYALLFPFRKLPHFILGGAVATLVGWLVKTMATPMEGLDKNSRAKDDLNVTVIDDEYARQVVETGVTMLDALKKERDAINEYVFTRRLDDLRGGFDQLLRCVISDPDKAGRIRKLNTYYFPTAIKLLESYRAAKAKGTDYHTMSATREDLLAMLDSLIEAVGKLHTAMLQDDLEGMDIEMDVLDQMLRSDGLAKDDLTDELRRTSHEAAKTRPISQSPVVRPQARTAPQPVAYGMAEPAAQPAKPASQKAPEAPYIPVPAEMDYKVQPAPAHHTPAPVLNMPGTASAAQMQQGAPVLHFPEAPAAPDFTAAHQQNANN